MHDLHNKVAHLLDKMKAGELTKEEQIWLEDVVKGFVYSVLILAATKPYLYSLLVKEAIKALQDDVSINPAAIHLWCKSRAAQEQFNDMKES